MSRILNKIYSRRLGKGRLLFSAMGLIAGLSLVMLSLQLYLSLMAMFRTESTAADFIVVSKDIGLGNTLFNTKAKLSEEDVEELRKQKFVERLGVFTAGEYSVTAYSDKLGFRTELFFESVPDEFIDDRPPSFRWYEGDKVLPVILSQEFLDMYNFGFAAANHLPQLSPSTAGLLPLNVRVQGPGGIYEFEGKITGFSNRVSSVLVPEKFMHWANERIGKETPDSYSRVIIRVNRNFASLMEEYFDRHDLRADQEKIRYSKAANVANIIVSSLAAIGACFIVFSIAIVIMNFSLLVAETKEETELLKQLGYRRASLLKHLFGYFLKFYGLTILLCLLLFFFANRFISAVLVSKGIAIDTGIHTEVIVAIALIVLFTLLTVYLSLRKRLYGQL